MMKTTVRPLDGILVVSLEHAIAAPFCTRQLADLGARVVKIERPEKGDFARAYDTRVNGMASHFVWTNRSKESLAIDIKKPDSHIVLSRLLEQADVFVQNLAPGATDRLGLSFAELSKRFPRLIVCDISGYGDSGPYRDKKAYDLLIQSESGFLSITGSKNEPAKSGCSIADISAGMYAYSNILAALIQRERTGYGSRVEISMLEAMSEWMGYPLYYTYKGAPQPERTGAFHATIYPYGPFKAGDDSVVMLGLQNEREWVAFCRHVLNRPDLAEDPRFASNSLRTEQRFELQQIIDVAFAKLTGEGVIDRLNAAGIACARVNSMHDLWEHPQLKARGRWQEVGSPEGPVPALIPPGLPSSVTPRMDPIPSLGEHSMSILNDLGFNEQQIAAMKSNGTI